MGGNWVNIIVVLVVILGPAIAGIWKKVEEKRAQHLREIQRRRLEEEMLRTGRDPNEESNRARASEAERLSQLAAQRRTQLEELRRKQQERLQRGASVAAAAPTQAPARPVPQRRSPQQMQPQVRPANQVPLRPQTQSQRATQSQRQPQRTAASQRAPQPAASQRRTSRPKEPQRGPGSNRAPEPSRAAAQAMEVATTRANIGSAGKLHAPSAARVVDGRILTAQDWRRAFILREILDPPISQRNHGEIA